MPLDLRHFPRVVREYREDSEGMTQLGQVLAIVAIVMLTVTVHTMAFQDEVITAQVEEELAVHQAGLIASCMNGKMWVYKDPHTGDMIGVFCDVQTLSRKM